MRPRTARFLLYDQICELPPRLTPIISKTFSMPCALVKPQVPSGTLGWWSVHHASLLRPAERFKASRITFHPAIIRSLFSVSHINMTNIASTNPPNIADPLAFYNGAVVGQQIQQCRYNSACSAFHNIPLPTTTWKNDEQTTISFCLTTMMWTIRTI